MWSNTATLYTAASGGDGDSMVGGPTGSNSRNADMGPPQPKKRKGIMYYISTYMQGVIQCVLEETRQLHFTCLDIPSNIFQLFYQKKMHAHLY